MPQMIKTAETKLVTKNGECAVVVTIEPIKIEITVNVNSDGTVNTAAVQKQDIQPPKVEEKTEWAIPTFGNKKINFGKLTKE